ncbi:hypothetical protein GCM10010345_78630 [Streptomyces canarius]|uniref:Uncharacterized protein n=1 Tax=Streptomyces canarius TaxID=285453 RepID=A0ABQ3D7F9_9ACTN|nr:hypothetical protein GCM10010345_78630 [Streptomyces canarius]
MQAYEAEHGMVDAVAFQAAVEQDLPALQAGEGVLDAGAGRAIPLRSRRCGMTRPAPR